MALYLLAFILVWLVAGQIAFLLSHHIGFWPAVLVASVLGWALSKGIIWLLGKTPTP